MLTRCVPCAENRHGRCQHGQPTLGGDCGCWCIKVKADAIKAVQLIGAKVPS